MPNWCSNELTLSHADSQMIARAKAAIEKGEFFQEFHPCPQELRDTMSGFKADPLEQKRLERQQKANKKKYGATDWYEWCVANWSTKWDVGEGVEAHVVGPNRLTVRFATAWSPPIKFYEKLTSLGFKVRALYHEGGMGFAGVWNNGDDLYVEGWSNSEEAAEMLPPEVDSAFGISEMLADMEADNRTDAEG